MWLQNNAKGVWFATFGFNGSSDCAGDGPRFFPPSFLILTFELSGDIISSGLGFGGSSLSLIGGIEIVDEGEGVIIGELRPVTKKISNNEKRLIFTVRFNIHF